MAFVKLDRDILESTLWIDRDQRDVFITALLLAEPREFINGAEQIAVGKIELTGWAAPPGWYGFVPAAGPGIVGRAGVPNGDGMAALRKLGEPDPESRSKEHEGRRMIRIDGGYLVLNYMKHREKDHTSPMRSARYRERLKLRSESVAVTDESRRHGVTSHTRARARSMSSALLGSDPDPEGVQGEPVVRPVVLHVLPAEYVPSESLLASAEIAGCPRETFMAKLAELGDGPIGGARGVLSNKLESYLLKCSARWRTWVETDRAKDAQRGAPQTRQGAITVRDDRGSLLVLEPSQAHRAYAAKHGLDLTQVMNHIREHRFVETLGLERARECIKELLVQAARKKGKPPCPSPNPSTLPRSSTSSPETSPSGTG